MPPLDLGTALERPEGGWGGGAERAVARLSTGLLGEGESWWLAAAGEVGEGACRGGGTLPPLSSLPTTLLLGRLPLAEGERALPTALRLRLRALPPLPPLAPLGGASNTHLPVLGALLSHAALRGVKPVLASASSCCGDAGERGERCGEACVEAEGAAAAASASSPSVMGM